MEFSSGLYLTGIRPVLEPVTEDWTAIIENKVISCSSVSNKKDNTGKHLLHTQLALHIKNKDRHMYHSKDKILLQSSSVISPGISSATWLVKYLIEPLVAGHISANHQTRDQVNNDILTSVSSQSWACQSCKLNIDPAAAHARDLPLTCNQCSKMFHKKCSDRRDSRGGGWSRQPWFCPTCVFGTALLSTQNTIPSISQPPLSMITNNQWYPHDVPPPACPCCTSPSTSQW